MFAWCVIKEALCLRNRPVSFWDNAGVVWDRGKKRVWMVLFASVCWTLWLIRNDWVFKDILVSSPLQVVYRSLSFALRWKMFLKEEEQRVLDDWLEAILEKLRQVKPNVLPADI